MSLHEGNGDDDTISISWESMIKRNSTTAQSAINVCIEFNEVLFELPYICMTVRYCYFYRETNISTLEIRDVLVPSSCLTRSMCACPIVLDIKDGRITLMPGVPITVYCIGTHLEVQRLGSLLTKTSL